MTAKRHGDAGRGLRRAVVAVVVLLAVALAGAARGKEKDAPKPTPQLLEALARQYLEAGLPLPPPRASMVLLQTGTLRPGHPLWAIGFRAEPGESEEASDQFLAGTELCRAYQADSKQPATRPLNAAKGLPPPSVELGGGWAFRAEPFPVNHWLALAIQCHQRGDDRLAEQIFERGLTRDDPDVRRITPLGDGGPRDSLAATAWNHWMSALLLPDTDRREILAHLEMLSAAFPALDGPFQRDYLASLRLTLAPSGAAPDSAEALIDALIDHNTQYNSDDLGLETLGFAAVPALIAHLDDRRLTRDVVRRGDGSGDPQHVGEVIDELLQTIAGGGNLFLKDLPDPSGGRIDRATAEKWWARARAMGEEAYMSQEVFPPTVVSLQIVSARYPRRLEEIYARMLKDEPDQDVSTVAQTIASCPGLNRAEQFRLLRAGMAAPNLERGFEAFRALLALDPKEADAALADRLDHWPTEARSYAGEPSEGGVSEFVLNSDSAEVWRAYERALFRARPALRMQMLERLASVRTDPPQDVRQMATLDLFLDDPEVRVIRKEDQAAGKAFENYPVTNENRRLSVGNFVAGLLANLLKVKPPAGTARTERWWAAYRASLRAAIDAHERDALLTPIETE